jgi:hypothetical protein
VRLIEGDEMLDLLRCREMPPAGWKISDARHTREGDDAAVFGTDAEPSLSLERRACHRAGYVAAWRREQKKNSARV